MRCPYCSDGTMHIETFKQHIVKVKGMEVVMDNVKLYVCDRCHRNATPVAELQRWEDIYS